MTSLHPKQTELSEENSNFFESLYAQAILSSRWHIN